MDETGASGHDFHGPQDTYPFGPAYVSTDENCEECREEYPEFI
jgi:hypothetical protein